MDKFLLGYLIFINIAAYIVYALDKYYAIKGKWRIPERTLFLMAILGGGAGCILAMYTLHHKTRHKAFTIGVPMILAIEILIIIIIYLKIL